MNTTTEKPALKGRLTSLDALRGLDMFFLVGLGAIFRALPELSDNAVFTWLAGQCRHPEWQGYTAWDQIFPMFIFIVGAAMPFSFSKRMNEEGGKKRLFRHVLKRTLILMVLGAILHKEPFGISERWGLYSVLYRIGFSYFFAAIILMNTNLKGQIYWAFGILIGYYLMLRFIPVPGYGMGDFSAEGNLKTYLSEQVAEHIAPSLRFVLSISLVTSVSNALFGAIAGQWLMSERSEREKTRWLLLGGIVFILAALLFHLEFPINKKMGSSSFVLLTAGISAFLLGSFYWLIDVKGRHSWWVFFLVVVGVNPITIYLAGFLVRFGEITRVFVGGFDFGNAQALMFAITLATIKWLFLYYLYKNRVFLKI